ncbi:ATP-binding protein [Nitratiruptor tergarcus]|uniref:ATPase n=1 Tax=Nitratiruptor tergarcus DSM 16512 TaxID=1069081 RepID=A0A1W1WTB7_9BACT|nr:ATP-binding protein [Nitratiruptor tergarcus]SMC09486.1 hypothetical protein SAMN05660197_1297 [Nitratiruptor tergarcus DSM 16512]
MFVDREKELKILEKEYNHKNFRFCIIYGRRRVGKTALIQKFLSKKRGIYFLATLENEHLLLEKFKNIVADYFADEFLRKVTIGSFEELFLYIVQKNQKVTIVIDEFQYLAKVNPAIASIFQTICDNYLKSSNIFLILCGSIISMMYRETLAYSSPLYGRRTSNIKLSPLQFIYIDKFFPKKKKQELIEIYSILGGIPKYLEIFGDFEDIFATIESNILDPNAFLYYEPYFLLQDEINEPTTYFSILEVIAAGEHKIGNIAKRLQKPVHNFTTSLQKLIDLEIIVKEVPITETNPQKSKKGLYFIKDQFLRFWFAFVFPFKSYLEMGNKEYVIKKIKESFDQFVSKTYEELAIDFVKEHFSLIRCGRWWSKNEEIDLVGIGDDYYLFGECKWQKRKVCMDVYQKLVHKSALIEYPQKKYILFSKSGFTQELIDFARNNPEKLFLVEILDFIRF